MSTTKKRKARNLAPVCVLWRYAGCGIPVVTLEYTLMAAGAQGPDSYTTYYVAPGGNCGAGVTPCYSSVQKAVDAADDAADVVKVAAGTYTDASVSPPALVYINKSITIRGGYLADTLAGSGWKSPDPVAHPTTLDAQGRGWVLHITPPGSGQAISVTIEGLRITGGDATGLSDFWCGPDGGGSGGRLHLALGTATLESNTIVSNTAGAGGGIYQYYDHSTLSGNLISDNTASHGGGVYQCLGNATVRNSSTGLTAGSGLYVTDFVNSDGGD